MYDFIIVGSGLYGAVCAHELNKAGLRVIVLERRDRVGGNVACTEINGITVHEYGPHIFHTSDKDTWDYVNRFCTFRNFIYSPLAYYQKRFFNMPFNMNTFYQLWGVLTPVQAIVKLESQRVHNNSPKNLEEQALALVGRDVYETLIKGYTEKHWGRPCSELPESIIKRLPIRLTFDNNYFNDTYQGIPVGGYNVLINELLKGIEVRTGVDYAEYSKSVSNCNVIYTGGIDEYYNYRFGKLEYRGVEFVHVVYDVENYQGVAVVNFTDSAVPFTRRIEHKHFSGEKNKSTVVTYEYPIADNFTEKKFYPIATERNKALYKMYVELSEREEGVVFGGRLGEYRYYDMHQVIAAARKKSRTLLSAYYHESKKIAK